MKRVLSGAIIFVAVLAIFLTGNIYVVDLAICLISIRCIKELFDAFEKKDYHPIKWVAYLGAVFTAVTNLLPNELGNFLIKLLIPAVTVISFIYLILKSEKINIMDVLITIFGMLYIVLFLNVLTKITAMNNGNLLIWYVFIPAWITDVCALYTGKTIGKHHFTKISPNKTIEGCIGGTIGAILVTLLYTILFNQIVDYKINYIVIGIAAFVLSIIGQIGDLAASSIKRYVGEKDFSNLIPGHGGMLDRIDSIIFIAPFAYLLLTVLI